MPDRIDQGERTACFGPPEDEEPLCKAPPSDDENRRPAAVAALPVPSSASDYGTAAFSLNLAFFSVSVSHTTDRLGEDYWGLGVSAGASLAPPVGVGATAGKLIRDDDSPELTHEELREYLCGPSVSARAGMGAEAGIANSSGGTAFEWGAETAVHASVGFSYNWGEKCP